MSCQSAGFSMLGFCFCVYYPPLLGKTTPTAAQHFPTARTCQTAAPIFRHTSSSQKEELNRLGGHLWGLNKGSPSFVFLRSICSPRLSLSLTNTNVCSHAHFSSLPFRDLAPNFPEVILFDRLACLFFICPIPFLPRLLFPRYCSGITS